MNYLLQPYDDALDYILKRGIKKMDRTGVGCLSVAGLQCKYALDTEAFPIVTRRKMFPKSVFAELLWVISGSTKNQDLEALGARFWGKWCDESNPKYQALRQKWGYEPGDFGPIYGFQLRHFGADYVGMRNEEQLAASYRKLLSESTSADEQAHLQRDIQIVEENLEWIKEDGFDQLAFMVNILKNDPFGSNGRRCLFSLWNPNDLDKSALPPCHYTYQAIADGDGGLTGILTQRSCDFPVGIPANIQFYSALTIMLAQQTGFKPREFIHNTNDSHIYFNQIEQVEEYLSLPQYDCPKLFIKQATDIFSYTMSDFLITGYECGPKIDIPVAV